MMAIMLVFAVTMVSWSLLDMQDTSIHRAAGIKERAEAVELVRLAVSRTSGRLVESTGGLDLHQEAVLDLSLGEGVRVEVTGEQGKINLNNVVVDEKPNAIGITAFMRLLKKMDLPQELADTLTDWIDPDNKRRMPSGAEDEYYLGLSPPRLTGGRYLAAPGELASVKGFGMEEVDMLTPHVTALPEMTELDINSATAYALAASIDGLDVEDAQRLVEERKSRPFKNMADFRARLPRKVSGVREQDLTLDARYFMVAAETTGDGAWVRLEALVKVDKEKKTVRTIWRRSI